MTQGLTKQQARCLGVIKSLIASNGVSPSFAEIGLALGEPSMSGVTRLVHGLRDRGAITFIERRARSIRVIEGPTREAMVSWSKAEHTRVLNDLVAILNIQAPSMSPIRSIPVMGRID